MRRIAPEDLARAAVVVLAVAILLCLSLPMTGAMPDAAAACCLALALVVARALRAPRPAGGRAAPPLDPVPISPGAVARRRPADPVFLSALLI